MAEPPTRPPQPLAGPAGRPPAMPRPAAPAAAPGFALQLPPARPTGGLSLPPKLSMPWPRPEKNGRVSDAFTRGALGPTGLAPCVIGLENPSALRAPPANRGTDGGAAGF